MLLAAGLTGLALLADGLAGPPALQSRDVEPAVVCRMRPECDKSADCDERCGVGLAGEVLEHLGDVGGGGLKRG